MKEGNRAVATVALQTCRWDHLVLRLDLVHEDTDLSVSEEEEIPLRREAGLVETRGVSTS